MPRNAFLPLLLLTTLFQLACAHLPPAPPVLQEHAQADRWARAQLKRLSLREKIGQLIMVDYSGVYLHPESERFQALRRVVVEEKAGGLVLMGGSEVYATARLTNRLQGLARLPLLIASDLEGGPVWRVRSTTTFPGSMALGASGSEDLAFAQGRITALEARAMGVHLILAPVLDVNNNPENPIINIRSYGEDPGLVARLGAAFIRGVQENGALATAKHFPGHGDTTVDPHLGLPVILADRIRLDTLELAPFKRAIAAGVGAIMTAHLALPTIDSTAVPATFSSRVTSELLRQELGFDGLILTDALNMAASMVLPHYWLGAAAVRAIQAGADILLMPQDPHVAIQALIQAVERGDVTESRLEQSVLRILRAKARLGLHRERLVSLEAPERLIASPEHSRVTQAIAEGAITLVKDEPQLLPLDPRLPRRILSLVVAGDPNDYEAGAPFQAALKSRVEALETAYIDPRSTPEELHQLLDRAQTVDLILASLFVRIRDQKGTVALPQGEAAFLDTLSLSGRPVVTIAFGSPYPLRQVPRLPIYLAAYSTHEASQRAAVQSLFGETSIPGHLPTALPDLYPIGHGLTRARLELSLKESTPAEAGFDPQRLERVAELLRSSVQEQAFPGAVILVGHQGRIALHQAIGSMRYDPDAPAMPVEALFDLASLTKVVVTTTLAMLLYEESRLNLDYPVAAYLPEFGQPGKEAITIRHLLTHSSGLPAWKDLYREVQGPKAYLERISTLPLEFEPGSQSLYSDLGIIVLGQVLERIAGKDLSTLAEERILRPLGMRETRYHPPASLRPRIPPTEFDPWRGRLLQGEVHDENAAALGGAAPHAGLFSTARDLAIFAQMMLNGGIYDHKRIVKRSTVELFTRRQELPPGSSRALGWDTLSAEGSSAGEYFSPQSYGHTGFTGTSLWIDPVRELFVVLLTNRVHPTRENNLIREVRPRVHDAVIEALVQDSLRPAPTEKSDFGLETSDLRLAP